MASNAGISAGFLDTEVQFTEVVREAFDDSAPHLATVGACTAAVLVTRRGLWAANVGDCRAVLGQVRGLPFPLPGAGPSEQPPYGLGFTAPWCMCRIPRCPIPVCCMPLWILVHVP